MSQSGCESCKLCDADALELRFVHHQSGRSGGLPLGSFGPRDWHSQICL